MIPIQKLAKLPGSQRIRKVSKIFGEAEHRFLVSGKIEEGEAIYLGETLGLLIEDGRFPHAAAEAFNTALNILSSPDRETGEIRRALNTVYHILLAETGCCEADWDFIGSGGALDPSGRYCFPGMQVYLEDIRSPFNVGAMFRTAESFGAEKIWLSPLCADPGHKRAERTAMGCIDILSWERLHEDPFSVPKGPDPKKTDLSPFDTSRFPFDRPLFTMETGGTPLTDYKFPSNGILIAGSEELGVSPLALAAADASMGRVTIPMYGAKGSLNVSVAFGIVMQSWAAQLHK